MVAAASELDALSPFNSRGYYQVDMLGPGSHVYSHTQDQTALHLGYDMKANNPGKNLL
jgi:hypothetical protein